MNLCWGVSSERPRFIKLTEEIRRIEIEDMSTELQSFEVGDLDGHHEEDENSNPFSNNSAEEGCSLYSRPRVSLEVLLSHEHATASAGPNQGTDLAQRLTNI